MNINVNSLSGSISPKTNSTGKIGGEVAASKKDSAAFSAKVDTVTISRTAAEQSQVSKLARTIAAEVDAPVSAAKISQLKGQINNGEYNVPASDVASAILGNILA